MQARRATTHDMPVEDTDSGMDGGMDSDMDSGMDSADTPATEGLEGGGA